MASTNEIVILELLDKRGLGTTAVTLVPSTDITLEDGVIYCGTKKGKDKHGEDIITLYDIAFNGADKNRIYLNPESLIDRVIIEYAKKTNFNQSNPNRSTHVQPLFRVVDEVKATIANNAKLTNKYALGTKVSTLSAEKLTELGQSLAITGNTETVLQSLLNMIESGKGGIIEEALESSETPLRAKVAKMLQEGELFWDDKSLSVKSKLTQEALCAFSFKPDNLMEGIVASIKDEKTKVDFILEAVKPKKGK